MSNTKQKNKKILEKYETVDTTHTQCETKQLLRKLIVAGVVLLHNRLDSFELI